ncbi:MAG: histidine kinase N-terminal 7TM domain-containing protein, partial [Thermodesulfobacteriota bacterium]
MKLLHLPTLVSFLAFASLGTYVLLQNRKHWVNVFFALGMGSLALMELGNFMALVRLGGEAGLFWKRVSLVGECLVPVFWLSFSMSFARKEPWYAVRGWRAAFIGGVGGVTAFFLFSVASGLFVTPSGSSSLFVLERIGKLFYIAFLLSSVVIVANLEHTIRQARGDQRARIRYFVLGLGGLFGFLIFLAGQSLLFSRINLDLVPVSSSVFVICSFVIALSLV